MENEMLEQIQQMITTATDSLRRDFRQDMADLESRLGERIEGIGLAQRATESRLGERIDETKRHSGILAEDLHHKLDLVIEGQQFLGQRIDNVQADLDAKTRETRLFLEVSHRQLNDRLDRHEQSHHT